MTPQITVERVEAVPEEANVHHYDELEQPAQEQLPQFVDGRAPEYIEPEVGNAFEKYDLIKFTEYYQVVIS